MAKLYFEATITNTSALKVDQGVGLGPAGTAFDTISGGGLGPFAVGALIDYLEGGQFGASGGVFRNNVRVLTHVSVTAGQVVCWAYDTVANLAWRRTNGGNWNESAPANPATGVGGIDISALGALVPIAVSGNNTNFNVVFDFGATGFSQAVPAGFAGITGILNSNDVQAATLSTGNLTFQSTVVGGLESGARLTPYNLVQVGNFSDPAGTIILGMQSAGLGGIPNPLNRLLLSIWVCGNGGFSLIDNEAALGSFPNLVVLGNYQSGGFFDVQVLFPNTGGINYGGQTATPIDPRVLKNILVSFEVTTSRLQVYVNDVALDTSSATFVPAAQLVQQHLALWGQAPASAAPPADAYLGDFYVTSPAAFYDLSITGNRRKFLNADVTAVDLGYTGGFPTGVQPAGLLRANTSAASTFGTNFGSGGTWAVEVGTLAFEPAGFCSAPGIPINLHSTGQATSSIDLAWTAGSGSTTSYTLRYRLNGTAPWTGSITGIAGLTQTVSGLTAGTLYDFQIQALNAVGPSGFSNTVSVATLSQALPVPPQPQSLRGYRCQVGINFRGQALVGDAYSGVVGKMNFDTFTEYGNTMRALIVSPPVHKDRVRVFVDKFEIDVESGVGLPEGQGSDPQWMLDWSKDGGRTWSSLQLWRSMGRIGEYTKRLRWLKLGQSRQWIFRLQSTDPVRRVIIGTYLDVTEGMK